MPEYRRKPIVVEAFQWSPSMNPLDVPAWFVFVRDSGRMRREDESLIIHTPKGEMTAAPGDWIIWKADLMLTVCADGVFRETYEMVDEPEQGS